MLDSLIAPIAAWIVGVISAAGYTGFAGLMALESSYVPLPSEIIMPFAGFLATMGAVQPPAGGTCGMGQGGAEVRLSRHPVRTTSQENRMHDAFHEPRIGRAEHRVAGAAKSMVFVAMLAAGLACGPGMAAAQDALPRPPCTGAAPFPAFPAASTPGAAPAVVQVWQKGQGPRWAPPACTGWMAGAGQGFRTLVALAGRIQPGGGPDQMLDRFGAISLLPSVRYWSTSDGGWRPLVSSAAALSGPDPRSRRADFTAAELRSGRDAYLVQRDGRSSSDVVYRMRVLEGGPDRIVVATENVSPIRVLLATLFEPGALQAVHILQRLSADTWGYYGLSRTTEDGSSSFTGGHEASYVNRAAALYRHVAGVPTDRDPPMDAGRHLCEPRGPTGHPRRLRRVQPAVLVDVGIAHEGVHARFLLPGRARRFLGLEGVEGGHGPAKPSFAILPPPHPSSHRLPTACHGLDQSENADVSAKPAVSHALGWSCRWRLCACYATSTYSTWHLHAKAVRSASCFKSTSRSGARTLRTFHGKKQDPHDWHSVVPFHRVSDVILARHPQKRG